MTLSNNDTHVPNRPSEKELRLRKLQLTERLNFFQFKWWGWFLSVIFGGIAFVCFKISFDYKDSAVTLSYALFTFHFVLGALCGVFLYAYTLGLLRVSFFNKVRRVETELLQYDSEALQDTIEENFFTKLVQINFKYIDQYYLQTQEQADKSFRLAASASVAGLFIIAFGIVMMLFDKTEPAYVTTSTGVISEFIAAIFFYLYNRTILKMSQYHQKLVITQNISLALKITDEMSGDNKAESLKLLVERLTTDVNKHLTETIK